MTSPLLYSTNVFLKLIIQEQFRGDVHYVWCSESFDSTSRTKYSIGSLIAPSSNPADIYRELKNAVQRSDRHCHKISEQSVSLKKLALDWEAAGEISTYDKDEIIYRIDNASFAEWRPLVYIIPRAAVHLRIQAVPAPICGVHSYVVFTSIIQ